MEEMHGMETATLPDSKWDPSYYFEKKLRTTKGLEI